MLCPFEATLYRAFGHFREPSEKQKIQKQPSLNRFVNHLKRRTIAKITAFAAISGFFLAWIGIQNYAAYALITLHPDGRDLDAALGNLARAESAQTPDEVIDYVVIAKAHLPEAGSVYWWSPEKANFESIHAELDNIVIRAENISSLHLGDELYNAGMLDIHSRLQIIRETLVAF